MLDFLMEMLLTPSGARWELRALLAVLTAITAGVAFALSGHSDLSPYAAIAGFLAYVTLAVLRALLRPQRRRSRGR